MERADELYDICSNEGIVETARHYARLSPRYDAYRIIMAYDSNERQLFTPYKHFSTEHATVCSLFGNKNIFFIDKEHAYGIINNTKNNFKIDYSITLDKNIISYLHTYISTGNLPIAGFKDVFEFLLSDTTNYDNYAYRIEETAHLKRTTEPDRIRERLKAYEIFKTVDKDKYHKNQQIESTLTQYELDNKVEKSLRDMQNFIDTGIMDFAETMHTLTYCHILKGILIQFQNSKNSFEYKFQKYSDFCNDILGYFDERVAILNVNFFKKGKKIHFYSKINNSKNTKYQNLFKLVSSMAWDITHIRIALEKPQTLTIENNTDYFIPSFLSFDKGFMEVLELQSLKALIFSKEDQVILPVFNFDLLSEAFENPKDRKIYIKKYFSPAAIQSREQRHVSNRKRLPQIKETLEQELQEALR